MWNTLQLLGKNLTIAIPAMMVAGFLYGWALDAVWLKNLIIPFTFLMVYPMMVTLKLRSVVSRGDAKAQILAQAINFGIIPFAAYGIGMIFFGANPYMALGLLLAGLVPTSGMTISWTGFARGNMSAAVKMTVIGLILGSLATPIYVKTLMGESIPMDMAMVFKQILFIVFLPMALGHATQRLMIARYGQTAFQKNIGPKFPSIATLGVLGIVFVALALKARTIADSPQTLLQILVPLAALYALNFSLSTFLGRLLLPRGDAIAMVYGSVMRNLSIALAIAVNAFGTRGADAALVIALAYVIQVQSAAWYVKLTDRIFGQSGCESRPRVQPQES